MGKRGSGGVEEGTYIKSHTKFICDLMTRKQLLANTVPTCRLSGRRWLSTYLRKWQHTSTGFSLLFLPSDVIICTCPKSFVMIPTHDMQKSESSVDNLEFDSLSTWVSGQIEISEFCSLSSKMPTESRKSLWHPEVQRGAIYWCPEPAVCAFHSIIFGREDSAVSKLE